MAPAGALLWRALRVHQVYGANTDVGKTILTTILCNSASKIWKNDQVSYLKPVSTGPQDEADDSHLENYAPNTNIETLFQWDIPTSPHAAAEVSSKPIPTDHELLAKIHDHITQRANQGSGWLFLETAGGVHSPGPSRTTQADLYAPLRMPVILIGDSKLGGISQTVSAFESLRLRGYDVESVLLFREPVHENYRYLADYFGDKYGIAVETVGAPPARRVNPRTERESMAEYYHKASEQKTIHSVLFQLDKRHQSRIARLEEMPAKAYRSIWYPFTQQKHLTAERITAIDSAYGDHFQTLQAQPSTTSSPRNTNLLRPSFDGSASWWTQGLGHANPKLTLAAAYAAGRYGHVMFAEAIHEPAMTVAEKLLAGIQNPRLSRVFFSDNGSTGCEVAVKMALRAAHVRYGWDQDAKLGILGLKGSYHGDTIGAMDCAEPCTFNEKVEWYEGKGFWFDYPTVQCKKGKWVVDVPDSLKGDLGNGEEFASVADVFDVEGREQAETCRKYEAYIHQTLETLQKQGRKFGALMMEPVILGAGGMIFVDPLFQRTLVNVVRRSSHLFATTPDSSPPAQADGVTWTGLPVVFDEVFTGLYRLGRYTASSFLGVHPDVSVHAKLLTGGLVPLCTTLASDSVHEAFLSDDKSDALLHGHSYTAHAVGCQVALESLQEMQSMEERGAWDAFKTDGWVLAEPSKSSGVIPRDANDSVVWSAWSRSFIDTVSHNSARVSGVWALGSVLAITLRSDGTTGYKSSAALSLQARLREGYEDGRWNVHSRVLGNVFYIMVGQTTSRAAVRELEGVLTEALST
ncbi:Bifunctional dethiobiotin synthetase/7,8-diamino-pelargonic acid aminotransferase, mitochondrial [Neonectria ditissima]|uniref:Bifunctional dethiobiotin synthetase/7,8-diamino-pelargonic acid aminotransferase, mitochondrial n=1 Tax=Neonectria ditissima TaxID=78410 RepID=A0A0P7BKF9_9HYPO|nr:Bifunctional dethiobiotin synthetase/7,8-diamino-pelargonic acid aminotransferase, mitochondrial [Neonectria ditissima]